jgi:tripartite-type tricarboxylate transporter receptor subunit TctC
MEELPEVPTLKEAGADVDAVLWSGLFAPKDTAPEIVQKVEFEMIRIAKLPRRGDAAETARHPAGR